MGNMMNTIIFFVYLVLGLWFLNAPFNFVPLPTVSNWIIFVAGIFLIFGGIKYLRSSHFGWGHRPPVY